MSCRFKWFVLLAMALTAVACVETKEIDTENVTLITVGLPEGKAYLGTPEGGQRKVYWDNGDQICANGVASQPLSGLADNTLSTTFVFNGVLNSPYSILYPASAYVDATHVALPSTQTYTAGSFDPAAVLLAGQSASLSEAMSISHLTALLKIAVKAKSGASVTLSEVSFEGKDGEQISGSFILDYATPELSGNSAADADKKTTVSVNQLLSSTDALEIFIAVPAGTYSQGFTVTLKDSNGQIMRKNKSASVLLAAGKLVNMPVFEFAGHTESEFGVPDMEMEDLIFDSYNVTGTVQDTSGNPLEGVVVTDGEQCVTTSPSGHFYMTVDPSVTKFIYISTPSGYIPPVESGLPKFYKLLSSITPSAGIYDCGNFTLTPVANPDRFTILVSADPQPRQKSWVQMDRIAFYSLDVCEDYYTDLNEVASNISGQQVYGVCLGDIVHERMDLFATYVNGISGFSFPTYNIIGNHDHNPSAANDEVASAEFESYFGPCSYSFNIGKLHCIVLDDLIMETNPDDNNSLTKSGHGLTDRIWTWLQADLSFIPKTTKLMVFAHAPMFKLENGNERTNTSNHGRDYGALLNSYPEVHAWGGDSHCTFNYIYPTTHRNKNTQVHTLARSTGELWTNEYLANGTPRGFTIVEVDGNNISWHFHPNKYQTAPWVGNLNSPSYSAPSYTYRDWNYNASGVAVMKDGSGTLSDAYQMHAYPKGSYGDEYVYVNVFLWDAKWANPVFTPDGGGTPIEMICVHDAYNPRDYSIMDSIKIHDLAMTEIRSFYKANHSVLHGYSGYSSIIAGQITTLFRAAPPAGCNGGTVSVTDRFGNSYTRHVSW